MATATTGFAIGIAPEDKLSMPLDDLIKTRQKAPKKSMKPKPQSRKKQPASQVTVKKTMVVPVSKTTRARATAAASSAKRQQVVNKRRTGLQQKGSSATRTAVPVQMKKRKTSALRAARAAIKSSTINRKSVRKPTKTKSTIDVSNIERHFRSHPKKFDLPKGTNLRITINLDKVKPVIGTRKN